MTDHPADQPDEGAALRQMDILMGRGGSFARALDQTGISRADYLSARAAYMGAKVGSLGRVYSAEPNGRPAGPQTPPAGHLPGTCTVCGASAGFEDFNDNLRESGRCVTCGSYNRQRQMAHIMRLSLGLLPSGPITLPDGLIAHNTESTGALHALLRDRADYTFSEYWGPEFSPGEVVKGIRHEDMQRLSLADESLDLFLSSDVLEHMPDPYQAHAEVFRVLKPGGRHIFTVPFHGGDRDDVRAKLVNGEIQYLADKAYHGDPVRPDEGILVWTVFGMEMLDRLREIGFHAALWAFSEPACGILGRALVFEAFKPGPARYALEDPLYAAKAVQATVADYDAVTAELASVRAELTQIRAAAASNADRVAQIEASTSWRLTAPLRAMSAKLNPG